MNPPDHPTLAPTPRTDAINTYIRTRNDYTKTDHEVWIEHSRTLERELADANAECDLHRNRLASILWSGAIDKQLCGDVQQWAADYTSELTLLRAEVREARRAWLGGDYDHLELIEAMEKFRNDRENEFDAAEAECVALRTEVERFKAALADPHALHAHCVRTLTDGQIAHLFGERMTEVANRADKAEAELATEKARLDYLAPRMEVPQISDALNGDYSRCFPIRDAIDLAMKNETKTT
jgi:hypothetical protein